MSSNDTFSERPVNERKLFTITQITSYLLRKSQFTLQFPKELHGLIYFYSLQSYISKWSQIHKGDEIIIYNLIISIFKNRGNGSIRCLDPLPDYQISKFSILWLNKSYSPGKIIVVL